MEPSALRPEFTNAEQLQEEYSCAICDDIPVDPMLTPCQNRVCASCIKRTFGESETLFPCPWYDGPEHPCKDGLRLNQLSEDESTRNIYAEEDVYCTNNSQGCNAVMKLKLLKSHLNVCEFERKVCPNQGCEEAFSQDEFTSHKSTCEKAMVICKECNQQMIRKELQTHRTVCVVKCTQCGDVYRSNNQLELHQSISRQCLKARQDESECIVCEPKQLQSQYPQKDLHAHLADDSTAASHLESTFVKCYFAQLNMAEIRQEISAGLKKDFHDRNDPFLKAAAQLCLDSLEASSGIEELNEKIRKISQLSTHINNLKQDPDVVSVPDTLANVLDLKKRANLDDEPVALLKVDYSNVQGTCRELHEHIDKFVNTTSDGFLLWRIANYWKESAEAERAVPTFSTPFLTSKHGLKFVGCVFLNGSPQTSGSHIGLFVRVEKSLYDSLYRWPVKATAVLTLLCPRNPSNQITETFVGEFSRPTENSETNTMVGNHRFAQLTDIHPSARALSENETESDFIKDGDIYFTIEVQLDNQY